MEKAYETACTLLHHMNCHEIHELVSGHDTDRRPAVEEAQVVEGVKRMVEFFNN